MVARLLACWALLVGLAGFTAPDDYGLARIHSGMNFPGVEVTTVWRDCGQVNGYYYPATHEIVMCNELKAEAPPSFIRFVYAHEMAHAVIYQLDVPVIGSQEVAADELAAVMLLAMGYEKDVLSVASWFLTNPVPERPWDKHPGNERRGLTLACHYAGYTRQIFPVCPTNDYAYALKTWTRLLEMGLPR